MKKVKEWLKSKKIDDKIRQELRKNLLTELKSTENSKETRDRAIEIATSFLANLNADFESVKCDCENNSAYIIDSGHLVLEIKEDLGMNSSFKIHSIKL